LRWGLSALSRQESSARAASRQVEQRSSSTQLQGGLQGLRSVQLQTRHFTWP
jgi:hypothetical protein